MARTNYARYKTDEKLAEIEKKITEVFSEAEAELTAENEARWEEHNKEAEEWWKKLDNGIITEEEYNAWDHKWTAAIERDDALVEKIYDYRTSAYDVALSYVNDSTPEIYSLNYNHVACTLERSGCNIDYNLWDEATVRKLIVKDPDLLPNYPKKKALARGIDMAYTQKQTRAAILSGILQGKSVGKIAADVQSKIMGMSKTSAIRVARTSITEAQNAGRIDAMYAAQKMGIEVEKEWVATLDSRTRPTHGALDGVHVALNKKFSNGCDHPGDPKGPAAEVYNCRCTIASWLPNVSTKKADRWSKDEAGQRETVSNTTYEKWAAEKLSSGKTVSNMGTLANSTTFANTQGLSEEFKAGLGNALAECDNETVRSLYENYADRLVCAENDYTGENGKSGAFYRTGEGIHIDEATVSNGDGLSAPYQTAFHEFGHNLDNLLGSDATGDWTSYASTEFYSGTGKSGAKYSVSSLTFAIFDDYDNFKQTIKKKFSIDTSDDWNVISYLREDGFSLKAVGNISDIIEGCTNIDFPLGAGHEAKYHRRYGSTAKEFFAETLDSTVSNQEDLEQMKRVFPNAVQMVYDIIGGIK